jgi:hypothetical protein
MPIQHRCKALQPLAPHDAAIRQFRWKCDDIRLVSYLVDRSVLHVNLSDWWSEA